MHGKRTARKIVAGPHPCTLARSCFVSLGEKASSACGSAAMPSLNHPIKAPRWLQSACKSTQTAGRSRSRTSCRSKLHQAAWRGGRLGLAQRCRQVDKDAWPQHVASMSKARLAAGAERGQGSSVVKMMSRLLHLPAQVRRCPEGWRRQRPRGSWPGSLRGVGHVMLAVRHTQSECHCCNAADSFLP